MRGAPDELRVAMADAWLSLFLHTDTLLSCECTESLGMGALESLGGPGMYVPCGEVGVASSQESSINGSRERVGSYYPLARPHAVPGVLDSTGCRSTLFGIPHLTAGATITRRAGNVVGVDILLG